MRLAVVDRIRVNKTLLKFCCTKMTGGEECVGGGGYILKYGSLLATVPFLIYEAMKETLRMKRHTFPVLTEW